MSYKHFNAVKQHLQRQDSQMGTVRKKMTLINDAFGAVRLAAATGGQSLAESAGIKAPLSIIVIALFKCCYVIFFGFICYCVTLQI